MSTPWTGETWGEELDSERGRFAPRYSPGGRSQPGRARARAAPPPPRRYPPPARRRRPTPRPWIFQAPGYPYASFPEQAPDPVGPADAAAPPVAAEPTVVEPASADPAVDEPRAEEPPAADSPPEGEAYEWEASSSPRAPSCSHPLVHTALPTSGPGFYTYKPARQRFGMAETVQALLAAMAGWAAAHPRGPRVGIGDLSLRCGENIAGHVSHRRGIDADLRPVRADGVEGPVTYGEPGYSQALTQELVTRLRANGRLPVQYIFFNDPGIRGVRPWPNHHNHLHVRFLPPPDVTPELEIPELAGEFELAQRGPVATELTWERRIITSYPAKDIPAGGGVYIVHSSRTPIYVGEAASFRTRWDGRLQSAFQMGLVPGQPLTVWFGTYTPAASLTKKEAEDARRAIEHAIIRTLIKGGVVGENTLRNRRSIKQFKVIAKIQVSRLLPSVYADAIERVRKVRRSQNMPEHMPQYTGNVLHFKPGTRSYELVAEEWGAELGL